MAKSNCWIIYVLLLEDNCWYVGQTTSFAFKRRMSHHWTHPTKGAIWTRAHKPIRVYSVDTYDRTLLANEVGRLEDSKTLELAALYGFESVRGGGYCQREPVWPIINKVKKKKKKKGKWAKSIAHAEYQLQHSAKRIG